MSRELPILFSGPMVRAILDGRKTQTRRLVKWPVMSRSDGSKQRVFLADDAAEMNQLMRERQRHPLLQIKSPYALGDLLYVRESYAPNYFGYGEHGYRADWTGEAADVVSEPKWTPSIHMRKQDARIWLRVTYVRLERVQDISEEDARAEGMPWSDGEPLPGSPPENVLERTMAVAARGEFCRVWDAAYPGSWNRDDWVWVYEFERVEAPNA